MVKKSRQETSRVGSIDLWTALAASAVAVIMILAATEAQAQTFQVLHSFTGGGDGGFPSRRLTLDAAGNLYGTTQAGGNGGCGFGCGTVFKLSQVHGNWVIHTLYEFQGGDDGAIPSGNVRGPDGSIYGVTSQGGIGKCDTELGTCGTIFKVSPPPSACKGAECLWKESVLYRFTGAYDGGIPSGDPTFDAGGNLYGSTVVGGYGYGTVFKLTPNGNQWNESALYAFNGEQDSNYPNAGVIFDPAGNLYGAAQEGGSNGWGTIFQLTPTDGGWRETILYNFNSSEGGENPVAGLFMDSAGNLYGDDFAAGSGGCGTAFELGPYGTWNFSVLYNFSGPGGACGPMSALIMDAAGNLYGATNRTGAYNRGVVFKLTPTDNGWTYTSLHDFTGGSDGAGPNTLIMDAAGNLYGETFDGAKGNCDGFGCGVVFEITP